GGVDDSSGHRAARLEGVTPVPTGGSGHREGPPEVDPDDAVPVLEAHVEQGSIPQDTGVVDHGVEVTELVERQLDDPGRALLVGDVVAVSHGRAAQRPDLVDDLLRRPLVSALAVAGTSQVVDDDSCAGAGEGQRMFSTDASAAAGDDCDATAQRSFVCHGWS